MGLTRSAAVDFATRNVRVNAILPGSTMTPMMEAGLKGKNVSPQEVCRDSPMRRFGKPIEQAEAAVWLCSDRASFVTGIAMPVDGGQYTSIY
jgi:NAD(P)-dependent dehydrogenase (short-subunit alcohol dehydrogenase family)